MDWLALVLALLLPSSDRKPVARTNGKIIDCTYHSAWREPEGWTAFRAGKETLAVSPDQLAVLLRTTVATERARPVKEPAAAARAMAARVADVELGWSEPVVTKKNKYDHTTIVDGSGPNTTVRIVQRSRGFGKDLIWVEVAQGPDRHAALAAMDQARAKEVQLVDHACVCGTDCHGKRREAR